MTHHISYFLTNAGVCVHVCVWECEQHSKQTYMQEEIWKDGFNQRE